jgi:hypothetical protein
VQPQQAVSLPVAQCLVKPLVNFCSLVVQLLVQWEGLVAVQPVAVQPLALQWRLVLPIWVIWVAVKDCAHVVLSFEVKNGATNQLHGDDSSARFGT